MGDRPNHEGVRAASTSTIEIDFYYRGVRCRERIKLKPTPANLKRAANHRAAVLDAIERGEFDYAVTFPRSKNAAQFQRPTVTSTDTLDQYLSAWLEAVKPGLKASTWTVYARMIRHQIHDALGDVPLADLQWKHVKDYLTSKIASKKTKTNILSVLRTALDDAVDDELLTHNPLAGRKVRRGDSEPKVDEIDPFSADERQAIIGACTGQARNLIQFAFWTGMRISEICALDWGDVDWVGKRVYVQRALTLSSDKPETTKTAAGRRFVKLLPDALTALTDQKAHTYLAGNEIFQNPRTGERWAGDQPIRLGIWQRIIRKAGVRYRYPYQMRHTYASMMLQAGEPVMWVSQQLGHTSWAFTARTYSRWVSLDAPDAGEKAAAMWGKNADQKADHARQNRPNTDH